MKVYIACGLTHVPRKIFGNYVAFIHDLAREIRSQRGVETVKYALVDSDPQLAHKPRSEQAALFYAWDRMMVEEADLVVAEASFPSTGMGVELQIAASAGIPIIMMIGDYGLNRVKTVHYENPDHSGHDLQVGDGIVSLMALGVPAIRKTIAYTHQQAAISQCLDAISLFMPE
jgi:hypothetical protein